ncbi:MAG: alpha-hydroxy-acid oxidizing protein [Actinobacteria bacterium]|nr:alpha-hydroxy-acid oxidizing protein [Actinomycetota bacterium]
MKPGEILRLAHVGRPPAPYGVQRLARCYSIDDLAHLARRRLPAGALAYLDGGGEGEYTLRRNRAAFQDVELLPRALVDVSDVDTSTTVLGTPVPLPIALGPVGGPRMFHHEGERAAVRAAAKARLPFGVSTLATVDIDDIVHEAPAATVWFQLYIWGDREVARKLVARAQAAGCTALIVSADCTVRSNRERELHAGIKLPTPDLTVRTLLDGGLHPSWAWHFLTSEAITFPNVEHAAGRTPDMGEMFDGTVSWADVEWLREQWDGPLAVKGVLSPEDARHAVAAGADAVIVSNHGGRELDHVPATLDALPSIVDAVGDEIEVLFDSGIRRGTDILAALALGAHAVLLGRAYLYGLAAAGEPGVRHAIDILADELRKAMALMGAPTLADLDRTLLRPARTAIRA